MYCIVGRVMKSRTPLKTCFVISPIGKPRSAVRHHADRVLADIIRPALKGVGVRPIRSDQITKPGRISDHMFRAILEHDMCIAVLTGANPNVYYELAVAQWANRPVVILIKTGEELPFDVKDFRTLSYDLKAESVRDQRYVKELQSFVKDIASSGWTVVDAFSHYRSRDRSVEMPDVSAFGLTIRSPERDALVDTVDVEGTFTSLPPAGFELRSLRYYPHQHGFVPHGTIAIDRARKTWKIPRFDVGGESGHARGIEIALAGPEAMILLDSWAESHRVHADAMRLLRPYTEAYAKARWLPPITRWPNDLVTCTRVEVRRK